MACAAEFFDGNGCARSLWLSVIGRSPSDVAMVDVYFSTRRHSSMSHTSMEDDDRPVKVVSSGWTATTTHLPRPLVGCIAHCLTAAFISEIRQLLSRIPNLMSHNVRTPVRVPVS